MYIHMYTYDVHAPVEEVLAMVHVAAAVTSSGPPWLLAGSQQRETIELPAAYAGLHH